MRIIKGDFQVWTIAFRSSPKRHLPSGRRGLKIEGFCSSYIPWYLLDISTYEIIDVILFKDLIFQLLLIK